MPTVTDPSEIPVNGSAGKAKLPEQVAAQVVPVPQEDPVTPRIVAVKQLQLLAACRSTRDLAAAFATVAARAMKIGKRILALRTNVESTATTLVVSINVPIGL